MTSKEALRKAEARTGLPIGVNCCIMTETEMRVIEKDLEVLEIIRTHKLLNYVIKNKKCATMYRLTDEELNTLKEWLENERN